jgi:hypothetical protein
MALDRLDCFVMEPAGAELGGAARSSLVELDKNEIWPRPKGGYLLEDVVGLALVTHVKPLVSADELLGVGRALTEQYVARELSGRAKTQLRSEDRNATALRSPIDADESVALVVVPRYGTVVIANTLAELGSAVWGTTAPVLVLPLAPILAPVVSGFNQRARSGAVPVTRTRGRPKKAEVIRLVR